VGFGVEPISQKKLAIVICGLYVFLALFESVMLTYDLIVFFRVDYRLLDFLGIWFISVILSRMLQKLMKSPEAQTPHERGMGQCHIFMGITFTVLSFIAPSISDFILLKKIIYVN
jgi:hypothetical protein